jgi:Barstar (barnase inhibitor)
MITKTINLSTVACWEDFHDLFAREFSFPSYYGRNMDAWIERSQPGNPSARGMEGRDIPAKKYRGMRAVKFDDGDVSYSAVTKTSVS